MRALKWVGVLAAAALLAPSAATADRPPNILLILTDDQRYDSMTVMPRTERIFADRGVTYPEAFVTTPLCCPSRASIFSGQYAHNHGVTDNHAPNGGETFDPAQSWEHDLRRAGYFTGIVGKYLNGIDTLNAPHFAFRRDTPTDSTEPPIDLSDVDGFLASADSHDRKPWALVLAVHSPHYPFTVRPRDPRPIPPFDPPPSFGERSLSDKDPAVAVRAAGTSTRLRRRACTWGRPPSWRPSTRRCEARSNASLLTRRSTGRSRSSSRTTGSSRASTG